MLQVFRLLEHELSRKACICVHQGKTQIWNRGGVEPAGAAQLSTAARIEKPDAVVWRGDPELPLTEQGLTVLGAPVGQLEFVQAQLAKKGAEHEALLEMIDPSSSQCSGCVVAHSVLRRCEGELPLEDSTAGVDSGLRQTSRRAAGPLSKKGSPH